MHNVTVLEGEGIGREVIECAIRVLEATGVRITWDYQPIGEDAVAEYGDPLPPITMQSIARNKVAIKGPTGTPAGSKVRSYNVELRKRFNLCANVRPVRTMPGVKTRFSDTPVDLVIFRENMEDLYVAEEYENDEGTIAIARFTRAGCERIARYAFEYARKHGRKQVTIVHKANILKTTHGLFKGVAEEVAEEFPDIVTNSRIADNMLMQLVTWPQGYDCLLMPNLFGDLFSDLCAGLIGGLGFAPGANIGDDCAIFEAVHGTAPDIAGKGIANPTSIILSSALMLDHLGEFAAAKRIRDAVDQVLREGVCVTGDVNRTNPATTNQYTDAVIAKMIAKL